MKFRHPRMWSGRPRATALAAVMLSMVSAVVGAADEPKPADQLHPYVAAYVNRSNCRQIEFCEEQVKVSCDNKPFVADSAIEYFDNTNGDLMMVCGGACMRPIPGSKLCGACPPPSWRSCRSHH